VPSARVLWSLSLWSTGEFEWSALSKSSEEFFSHSGVQVNLNGVLSARVLRSFFSLWSTGEFEWSALSKSHVESFTLEYR
jgi:hypothetical protein